MLLNGGHISDALVECVAVLWRQLVAASVAAVNVNRRMIQTIDDAVVVAILPFTERAFIFNQAS